MNNWKILQKSSLYIVVLFVICTFFACTKMDDYKKYTEGGEISYTGKIDSLKIYSGKNRVLVEGLFIADPKITECIIYWNSGKDSLVVPINRTENVDTLRVLIEDIEENVHNFEVVTVDNFGNRSIPVHSIGTSYGDLFQSSLLNRPINKYELFAGDLSMDLNYGSMDLTTGVFATEVTYTGSDNEERSFRLPIEESSVLLEDYKMGSDFKYRTLYLPDTASIDTFYTDYASVVPSVVYLKNLGNPFNRASWDGSRWGNLANWITTSAVKNAGNWTYGGYELRGGDGVLSMEGGWGLPAVNNGKIYQVTTLPAGKYVFEPTGIDAGANGTRYVAVAIGTELPDVANVATEALKYTLLTSAGGAIEFELQETTQVAIGFVSELPDSGTYFKVKGINFNKLD